MARYGTFENGEESSVWHDHCAPEDPGKHVQYIGQDLLTTGEHPPCANCSLDVTDVDPVLAAAAQALRRMHERETNGRHIPAEVQDIMELLEAPVIRAIPELWDVPTPQRPGGEHRW